MQNTKTVPQAFETLSQFSGLPENGPAVWVSCLASYNSGELFGIWIDLEKATTAEEIQETIDAILLLSPAPNAEEWAAHDYQGLDPKTFGENPSPEDLAQAAENYLDAEENGALDAWKAYQKGWSNSYEDFQEAWQGNFSSGEYFAQELFDGIASKEQQESAQHWPLNCIDWEQAWRELEIGGDYSKADLGLGQGYAIFCENI